MSLRRATCLARMPKTSALLGPLLQPRRLRHAVGIDFGASHSGFAWEIELDEAGHLIEFTELLQRLQRRGPGISAQEIADHLGPAVEFMRFIAGEAVECINDSEGMSDPPHVVWAIAVPQTWSLADADALRAVCTDAGLIDRPDSPDLVLVPVWVAIAEALLSARLLTATTGREPFAIVDCAASETRMIVHHPRTAGSAAGAAAATAVGGMVVAPVRRDSLQVLAEAPSFALAAGARDAAEEFKSDLSSWLTPASWATVSFDYARDLRQLLLDWESLAHTFVDSAGAGERIWSVRLPPAFAPSQHGAFVLLPDAPVSVRRDASDPAAFWLDIPDVVLAAIFRRAIVPILDFVARNMAAPVRRIFFVGGFAASPEFQRLASLRFAASTECVFPSEPGHVVMRGVTLQALNTLSGDPASIQAVPIDRLLTRRSLPVQAPVLSPLSANSPTSASDPGMAMSQPDPVLPSPDEAAKDPQSAPAYHQRAHPHVLVTSATSLSLRRSSTRAGDLRTRPSNSALSWRTNSPMSARSEATTAAAVEEALAAEEAHEAALTRKRSGTLSAAGSAVERFSSTAAAAGSTVAGSRVTTEPASEPVPEREEQDAAYAQAGAAAASASQSSARWTKRPSEASTASSGLPVSDLVVGDHSDNELLDDGDALGDRSNIDGSVPISYDKDLPGVPSESHTRHDSTESGTRDRTISSAFSDHAAMSPDASMVARFGSASPMPSEADGPARVYTTLSHWVGHEPSEGRLLVSNSRASLTRESEPA
nr:hypothetical protein HK105_001901 [Polyrhizophydium stewartii]